MSEPAFQSHLVALVLDPDYRASVAAAAVSQPHDVSEVEWRRVVEAAKSPGMDACRHVHKAFRLTKLLTLLPRTCAVLGDDQLTRELPEFWRAHPPRGFRYAEEAAAFCDHLDARLTGSLLADRPGARSHLRATLADERPRFTTYEPMSPARLSAGGS